VSFRPSSHRGGFTLIETVVAAGVSAVLMLALGSTVMIAARAVPTGGEAFIAGAQTERGIVLLQAELEAAIDFYTDSTGMYLTAADRDGDGVDEFVVYSWSGSDRMMTRAYDNGDAEPLFGPVSSVTVKPQTQDGRTESLAISIEFSSGNPSVRVLSVRMLNQPVQR
jgi:hypothetical protein